VTLPIRKQRLGLYDQTVKGTHQIRHCRLGLFYQTVKLTSLIRKCRLDFFEQTEARLFRSDMKDFRSDTESLTLQITSARLEGKDCQFKKECLYR